MSSLYLITGFLGAGKTTFLKHFIGLFAGKKIQLIVNEFGREGVDGALLSKLGTLLNEISGGSVFCSCRLDQFEKALRESAAFAPDVILVEASGLSDPTGVRRLFSEGGRFPDIDYQGAICLVDAVRFPKIYATVRTSVKQLAASDIVLINKVDRATPEELEETRARIRGQRPEIPVLLTTFGAVDGTILTQLRAAHHTEADEMPLTADLTARKLMVRVRPTITPYQLKKFIEMFAENTFRVKGVVETVQGLYLADCVGNVVSVRPCEGLAIPGERVGWLNVLSGAGMPVRKAVEQAREWYREQIAEII